ncbi:TonB-dependent receptor [Microbulbifer spongiae]|uniref:TonB-dependent receptor n=1 Tax=Microbulbifer spongiae TaxID=2944933 RepID=A0ABY9EH01_9GAMM|nr:TonB-dependent receptor [Microbulbifer sp. MI-G]WKD51408.1 TonB-dependent receptor [Microbulbifer sp. MI-G]
MNRKFKKSLLGAAISFTIYCGSALADTGSLRITVTDDAGSPIAGAEVDVHTPESLTTKKGVTDTNGEIRLVGLDPSSKYEVEVRGAGYQPVKSENILVVSGQSYALSFELRASDDVIEEVIVTGQRVRLVDTTSTVVGQDITLDLTESLPTGRNYQSYLQLAPGTKPSAGGNPSSKSGVNYSDVPDARGRTSGFSSDNLYYIDNVNVTDNVTGTFGGSVNSEIIQEQHVLTGGLPAEYEGGSGLVSRVITKSGGNEFHGSVNYYMQDDGLVADNRHLDGNKFSTFDSAFTLGGPIIQDKLWFFTSYQIKEREDDVFSADGDFLREVKRSDDLGFAKLSWQMTENDKLIATFFNDPVDISGSRDSSVLNNRNRTQRQGGDNYKLEYSHSWDNMVLTLEAAKHEAEISTFAADKSTRNDVAYLADLSNPSLSELNLGGSGSDSLQFRNKDTWAATFAYFLDTNWGSHDIQVGYSFTENERARHLQYTGDEGAQYNSIANINTGATFGDILDERWRGEVPFSGGDAGFIINAINASADSGYYYDLLDVDNDNEISLAELKTLTFSSTAGNPDGTINAYRIIEASNEPFTVKTEGNAFYIQDKWSYGKWTVNAGVRAEQWEHFASDGASIFTFDWEFAPRLGVTYDINGDGDRKIWGFYGRYYDPIRTDMTSFAGTVTGLVRDEQVYIGDRWLTFRTRGPGDANIASTTKTPYTDEFMLGYSMSLGDDMSAEVTYTNRVTEDLLEDYDLALYTDPTQSGQYALPLSYFGLNGLEDIPNYTIATLKGGKREYDGVEFTFRKRRSDNWQMLASYTYNLASGNSNSDGDADFQGDVLWLDPRAPGVYSDQPGNIEHLFKVAGSYFFDNGIELGLVYNWNSGLVYSKTFSISGRHLPVQVEEPYESGGIVENWVDSDAVGSQVASSYGTLDARVKYSFQLAGYEAEFFLDIFNVLNDQAGIREQDLVSGDGEYDFGQEVEWVAPRRFYLGSRLSF